MRSSWGCVQRLDKDRYRIRYWADLGDGYRRHTETVRGTRREAERRAAELRAAHEVEPGAPRRKPSTVTVGDAWALWVLPEMESRLEAGEIAPNTLRNARGSWERHIAPRWSAVPCRDVEPLDVQEWLLAMTADAARLARIVMGQVMGRALMFGACQSNPMLARYRMPRGVRRQDSGVYTLDGLRDVLRAVHGTEVEPPVVLAAFGSARVGESLGVLCSEVSLREVGGVPVALAPVVRQVGQDGVVTERLKNSQSRRTLAVAGPVGVRLYSLARELESQGLAWLADDGLGAPVSQQTLNRRWTALLDAAGVERHPVKNLRNSWETSMHWALGVEPSMIERMMGHAGKTVTARHYDRPDEDAFAETAARAYAAHPYADTWDFLGRA